MHDHVMLDQRLIEGSPYYLIARRVQDVTSAEHGHVDSHTHKCDSIFIFLGEGVDYSGLTAEVNVDGRISTICSPVTVFIPAGYSHSYRFIEGTGTYINFVNHGEYNSSLLEL